MTESSSLKTLLSIRKKWPNIKILILSGCDDDYVMNCIIEHDINGYLTKKCSREELQNAILNVNNIGEYFSDNMLRRMRVAIKKGIKAEPRLSSWEIEVIKNSCADKTWKEIALVMDVSIGRIEGAKDNIFKKMGIHTHAGLVLYAIKNGLYQI